VLKRKKLEYNETHKEINGTIYKLCTKHKELFPNEDEWKLMDNNNFYINKQNKKDGFHTWCKKCAIILSQTRYSKNLEQTRKYAKEWNQIPEVNKRNISIKKIWKENNKEKHITHMKSFRENNKEKLKQYTLKRKMNKDHKISKGEWETCKKYFNNACAYCGMTEENAKSIYNQNLHKEHVENDGKNDLSNCIPACRVCNSKKIAFKFEDWYNKDNPIFDEKRYEIIIKWLNEDYKEYKK